MSNATPLRLERINHHYGQVHAVVDLSLVVPAGSFLTLLGPSGCGKSTTLSIIAGLERPTSGAVWLGDRNITGDPPNERGMAMVFQNYALYPYQSVFGNLAFGLKLLGRSKAEIATRVRNIAKILDIERLLERKPGELSGGQQQRVALGRALVKQPSVFLLDEPFSNLDAILRARMRTEVKHLHLQLGTTSVFVTHDQEEAMAMSDFIAVMSNGRLEQYGTQHEVYRKPTNSYVAAFVGKPRMTMVEGTLDAAGDGLRFRNRDFSVELPGVRAADLASHGEMIVLGVRAENLQLRLDGTLSSQCFEATVQLVEPIGSDTFVELQIGDTQLVARTSPYTALERGQLVYAELTGPVHLFDLVTTQRIN